MGQIQNAISGAVGSVAVGAIAEQKTKGLKKEISGLTDKKAELEEYMGSNAELIEDQQAELFKMEDQLKDVQARFSEAKSQLAETNLKKEQEAVNKGKEKYQKRLAAIQSKQFRGKK